MLVPGRPSHRQDLGPMTCKQRRVAHMLNTCCMPSGETKGDEAAPAQPQTLGAAYPPVLDKYAGDSKKKTRDEMPLKGCNHGSDGGV